MVPNLKFFALHETLGVCFKFDNSFFKLCLRNIQMRHFRSQIWNFWFSTKLGHFEKFEDAVIKCDKSFFFKFHLENTQIGYFGINFSSWMKRCISKNSREPISNVGIIFQNYILKIHKLDVFSPKRFFFLHEVLHFEVVDLKYGNFFRKFNPCNMPKIA